MNKGSNWTKHLRGLLTSDSMAKVPLSFPHSNPYFEFYETAASNDDVLRQHQLPEEEILRKYDFLAIFFSLPQKSR
jgi:hypothetical protein